ncbi:MAG: hypothetical protein M3Q33_07550 [Acidobacteriota bacterium]|nr:hypothetical protein [Acidobacteriota bacterium]
MMKNLINFFSCVCLVLLLSLCFAANSLAQTTARKIPAEVQAIAGNFTGAWTSYTLNDKGEIVKQAAWTDTIKAEKPTAMADRAFVETMDEMIFEGGRIPPQKIPGKEGYMLNKDGSLGDYYIEVFGQTIPMKKLSKDVWAYSVPANTREFTMLGDKFISGIHALVKMTTIEQGVETHSITRITTARWKDAEGKEHLTQYVSLQGQHKKAK